MPPTAWPRRLSAALIAIGFVWMRSSSYAGASSSSIAFAPPASPSRKRRIISFTCGPTTCVCTQTPPNADLDQARRILAETDLDLYAGDDVLVYPFLELGGVGGVCVHTHVVGPQVKEMIRRFREGDAEGAQAIDEELRPAYELLRVQTNPIAIKAAL